MEDQTEHISSVQETVKKENQKPISKKKSTFLKKATGVIGAVSMLNFSPLSFAKKESALSDTGKNRALGQTINGQTENFKSSLEVDNMKELIVDIQSEIKLPVSVSKIETRIPFQGNFSLPRISPDGKKYALIDTKKNNRYGEIISTFEIYEIGSEEKLSTVQRPDTLSEGLVGEEVESAHDFDWSPDSQGYIFMDASGETYDLFISPHGEEGNTYKLSLDTSKANITPHWSPDSKRIVYIHGNELRILYYDDGFKTKKDSFQETVLPMGTIENVLFPAWSPDSKQISFSGLSNGVYSIYIYDVNTRYLQTIDATGQAYASQWSPDGQKLAFYTNIKGKREQFDITIVERSADQRFHESTTVVEDVLQNQFLGPAWVDNAHIAYVHHDERNKHPVEMIGISHKMNGQLFVSEVQQLSTDTQYNADVAVGENEGKHIVMFQHYGEAQHSYDAGQKVMSVFEISSK